MPSHTIMLSISSASGFTREITLPGAGDLPPLIDVFGLALALLSEPSRGAAASTVPADVVRAVDAGGIPRNERPLAAHRSSPQRRGRRLH